MASEDARRDPVEVIRHARDYLKQTRGIERFKASLATGILDEAEKDSAKCIDYLLSDAVRAKGVHCTCDFHEDEFRESHFLTSREGGGKKTPHDGKAMAAGEDNQE
jgi:hypothetical protein